MTSSRMSDIIHNYLAIGFLILIVASYAGFQKIAIGSFLAAVILSFHHQMAKNVEFLYEHTPENSLVKSDIAPPQEFYVAAIDMIIAVPMFGLTSFSTLYTLSFTLGIVFITMVWRQNAEIWTHLTDVYQTQRSEIIAGVIASLLSFLYLMNFELQSMGALFYLNEVFPRVMQSGHPVETFTSSVLMSANNKFLTLVSFGVLTLAGAYLIVIFHAVLQTLSVLLLALLVPVIVLFLLPSEVSLGMRVWILTSLGIALFMSIYPRYLESQN